MELSYLCLNFQQQCESWRIPAYWSALVYYYSKTNNHLGYQQEHTAMLMNINKKVFGTCFACVTAPL